MTVARDARAGLRLALTTLTVLPLPAGRVDRAAARWAMALAPVAGALLGGLVAAVLAALVALGATPLLAAVLAVGASALATRGLHLDGLADLADGLGCGGEPDRALAVMRSPEVGPFGVATLVLTLGGQVAALAALAGHGRYAAAAVAVACGRSGIAWACRRGVPAARLSGLGALVACTLPVAVPVAWTVALGACAATTVASRPWQGPAAVLAGAAAAVALTAHASRRLSGVTGDVLGAVCEITVLTVACGLALGTT